MVPDFQSFFLPLLKFSADGKAHTIKEAREQLHKGMNLSEEDLKVLFDRLKVKAAPQVNSALITFYWKMGEKIVER